MSTFNGYIDEFPLIRVDAFRKLPGKSGPLACFLSHVHSDHLVGLESLKSPFVYCSAATREILLRLERYPHRINVDLGILERRIQTYKHLKKILKPLPLETPIKLELCPGNQIQVTLFPANHCLGAVMFLIQGQGKAVIYTGDIRCEAWWLDHLTRNPVLLPYCVGLRKLDKIYLDTTFAVKSDPYKRFPSKAEGIEELLKKVSTYSPRTVFYLRSWTFGYEDVWLALSNFLNSSVHLDEYRHRIYNSISRAKDSLLAAPEAACLAGFTCGNHHQGGILTKDMDARIHSCEKRVRCRHLSNNSDVVEIVPVVSRHRGHTIREHGAGGGQGDLDQLPALDLSKPHIWAYSQHPHANSRVVELCKEASNTYQTLRNGSFPSLDDANPDTLETALKSDSIKLDDIPTMITGLADGIKNKHPETNKSLPNTITFPYSRHSSYEELCAFVSAFKPADVYPCTAPSVEDWAEGLSMSSLFGEFCGNSANVFAFDEDMRRQKAELLGRSGNKRKRADDDNDDDGDENDDGTGQQSQQSRAQSSCPSEDDSNEESSVQVGKTVIVIGSDEETDIQESGKQQSGSTRHFLSAACRARLRARHEAFNAAANGTWCDVGLTSLHNDNNDDNDGDDEL